MLVDVCVAELEELEEEVAVAELEAVSVLVAVSVCVCVAVAELVGVSRRLPIVETGLLVVENASPMAYRTRAPKFNRPRC